MGLPDTTRLPVKAMAVVNSADVIENHDLWMRGFLARNKGWPASVTGSRPGSPSDWHIHRDVVAASGATSDYVIWDPEAGPAAWVDITGTVIERAIIARGGGATTTALALKAPLASPTFTGTPAAPTASPGTNTTQLATTAFVTAAVGAVSSAASGITNTPAGGIAATNVQAAINELDTEKAPLASPALTGTPTAPTAAANTNTTQIATTAYVQGELTDMAPLASPTFTGTPAAPTASPGTNTTQLATTAFVKAADDLKADLASPTFTGTPAAPTATTGTNTTQIATTAFVQTEIAAAGGLPAASQTDQEAASINTKAVTPGVQKFHPSAAKAWVRFNGSGTISMASNSGVSSITDRGVGQYRVNLTTAMSASTYAALITGDMTAAGASDATINTEDYTVARTTTYFDISSFGSGGGSYVDNFRISAVVFGDI